MQISDTQADFKQTVEKYKSSVYAAAYANLRSRSGADDVFQETFLLYYTKTLCFENENAKKAWLIRTALNLCKKQNGSIWAKRTVPIPEDDSLPGESAPISDEENSVLQAVLSLKEKYRIPVYLFYFSGLSTEEIAEILGIKSGAVQVRLVRARKELKEKLKGEYFYE